MSKNVKSLFIGAFMLIVGLILAFTTKGIETPIISLDKVGVVLAILGGIELVITGAMMIFPSKKDAGRA
ncbi:DUF5708 family protein [Crossiella cryophila]|uniref:Putative membrane-anchored protein n=1 Tax=Crossiella cryophila TaxID=43355 RepID=A0A7W7CAG8_9PSEU|nr:DUF5708 family protein [Crossiella cryophila]MBB4676099.1 putative membrane-anchored protein [Crossiella cryophila]